MTIPSDVTRAILFIEELGTALDRAMSTRSLQPFQLFAHRLLRDETVDCDNLRFADIGPLCVLHISTLKTFYFHRKTAPSLSSELRAGANDLPQDLQRIAAQVQFVFLSLFSPPQELSRQEKAAVVQFNDMTRLWQESRDSEKTALTNKIAGMGGLWEGELPKGDLINERHKKTLETLFPGLEALKGKKRKLALQKVANLLALENRYLREMSRETEARVRRAAVDFVAASDPFARRLAPGVSTFDRNLGDNLPASTLAVILELQRVLSAPKSQEHLRSCKRDYEITHCRRVLRIYDLIQQERTALISAGDVEALVTLMFECRLYQIHILKAVWIRHRIEFFSDSGAHRIANLFWSGALAGTDPSLIHLQESLWTKPLFIQPLAREIGGCVIEQGVPFLQHLYLFLARELESEKEWEDPSFMAATLQAFQDGYRKGSDYRGKFYKWVRSQIKDTPEFAKDLATKTPLPEALEIWENCDSDPTDPVQEKEFLERSIREATSSEQGWAVDLPKRQTPVLPRQKPTPDVGDFDRQALHAAADAAIARAKEFKEEEKSTPVFTKPQEVGGIPAYELAAQVRTDERSLLPGEAKRVYWTNHPRVDEWKAWRGWTPGSDKKPGYEGRSDDQFQALIRAHLPPTALLRFYALGQEQSIPGGGTAYLLPVNITPHTGSPVKRGAYVLEIAIDKGRRCFHCFLSPRATNAWMEQLTRGTIENIDEKEILRLLHLPPPQTPTESGETEKAAAVEAGPLNTIKVTDAYATYHIFPIRSE